MILAVGEILFDMLPEGRRLGGAPFNFAYHIHRLNGPLRFLSRIGNDPEGREIEDFLNAVQFPLDDLQRDQEHPTGRVHVTLDAQGSPQFEILPGVAYDYIVSTASLERFVAQECRLIYFGSLIQRTGQGAATLQRILKNRGPETKCLFDVNLRPDCWNADTLNGSLRDTDLLKLNRDELQILADINAIGGDIDAAVAALMARFQIEVVALTLGGQGSCLFTAEGRHDGQPVGEIAVKDTVGAGDAFAAMLAIGYLHGWPADRILTSASHLAAAVCGIAGATPTDDTFYDTLQETLTIEGGHA